MGERSGTRKPNEIDEDYRESAALASLAQFYAAALKAHPDIQQKIATGEFRTLHTWLRDHIYRHGSNFEPNDLVERATGSVTQMKPYLDYLREKYSLLYRLPASPKLP
jgi:Zn-dependent M32 family carboxypeptidase